MPSTHAPTSPSPLHLEIQERLLADEELSAAAVNLVDAACTGDAELASAIAQLDASSKPAARSDLASRKRSRPGVYLSKLKVSGFRGIGPECTLSVTPGPGLTLLFGRNGSGKSSFAEGLETLLTGESRRWADRGKEWRDGWKNLHTEDGSFVEATFAVEGGEPIVARRRWKAGRGLDESELHGRRGAQAFEGFDAIGWSDALSAFRPFLSYAELGALLSKPSELYDSLKAILGLEEVATAAKRLSTARKAREDRRKAVKERCKQLLDQLASLGEDPRAQRCHAAIKGRTFRLDEVEAVVLGDAGAGDDEVIRSLRLLAQLTAPSLDDVGAAVNALRAVLAEQATLAGSAAEQNAKLASLLEHALRYCGESPAECPVCGSDLEASWPSAARARLQEAREFADKAKTNAEARERCMQQIRALIRPVPQALASAAALQLPTTLLDAWTAWFDAPAEAGSLCDHAESRIVDLHAVLPSFVAEAQSKLQELESTWRPIALALAEWLKAARDVERESAALEALKAAEAWLKSAEAELRDARFEPIADRAQAIWEALRQQSSVSLAKIKLGGTGPKRRVELNVSVDGREGVAMSVMSQGELNALALSLFLPRMMLTQSPFRFLIIDDPVQAMDAHKVDGLARVLDEVAKTRQVIVLTHDARLCEALRRLQIRSTVLSVQRRAESVVELRTLLEPIEQHLKDALTLVNNEREIGARLAARTVPAFCRLAVEAACIEAIRRRRLGRGDTHEQVEELIESARTLHPLATLAIYDDPTREADVFSFFKNKLGKWAADTFSSLKAGTHGGFAGDVRALVSDTRKIADALRSQP